MAESQLYQPISVYQTRILCLHGHDAVAESPLRCDLYPADILHPSFGGIGVRSDKNGEDHIVSYEALSYAWGSAVRSKSIVCNNVPFAITENLYSALEVLRPTSDSGRRYIWIDALCINQSDPAERSRQVRSMLFIYQNATRVIAWLGHKHLNTKDALTAVASPPKEWLDINFPVVISGLEDLYSRSWFKRMWVQQEIHAAKQLVLHCGDLQFSWFPELSNPESILPPPKNQPNESLAWYKSKPKTASAQDPLSTLRASMSSLRLHNLAHLRCFEQFSGSHPAPIDFVETLLITGLLQTTDPKDHVYGILGLTDLPARPVSLQEWAAARPTDLHIPIDYSADLADILTTVSWLAVMKCGISIIAKFKSSTRREGYHASSHLPSWVIDWREAARAFQSVTPVRDPRFSDIRDTKMFAITVDNPWDTWEKVPESNTKAICRIRKLGQTPTHHLQFMEDNLATDASFRKLLVAGVTHTTKSSFRKLIVRGVMATQYYAHNNYVWEKEKSGNDMSCWHVPVGTGTTDIVVFLFNFMGFGFKKLTWESYAGDGAEARRSRSGGLWLLRPLNKDEYTLVACLCWSKGEYLPLYDHWQYKQPSGHEMENEGMGEHHRLAVEPLREGMDFKPGVKNGAVVDLHRFIIV